MSKKMFANVKDKIEDWFVKVAFLNGFASEDYVAEFVEAQVENSAQYLANSDWVEDVETKVDDVENEIYNINDNIDSLNDDVSGIEERLDALEENKKIEFIDNDLDNVFVLLGRLEEFMEEKYPDDKDTLKGIFAEITKKE